MVVPWYISDGADNLMLKVKEYLRGYVYKYSGDGRHVMGIFHDKDMVMKLKSDLVQVTERGLVNDKRRKGGGGEGDGRVFEYSHAPVLLLTSPCMGCFLPVA